MQKLLTGLVVALMLVGAIAVAASNAGSQSDPLVTVSHLQNTFTATIKEKTAALANSGLGEKNAAAMKKLEGDHSVTLAKALAGGLAGDSDLSQTVNLLEKDRITGKLGTQLTLRYGMARSAGDLVNLSTGKTVPSGSELTLNNRYMLTEKTGTVVTITTKSAIFETSGTVHLLTHRVEKYTAYAEALHKLGLFQGTNNGYELGRTADRAEGITMLIRLLGEEGQAKAHGGKSAFTDVADWNKPYVAYAFEKGYTKGLSATKFGASSAVLANHYFTFLLRALGYGDVDFPWDKATEKALEIGLIDKSYVDALASTGAFYRDDIVYVSYKALSMLCKDSQSTLGDKLVASGIFSSEAYQSIQAQLG